MTMSIVPTSLKTMSQKLGGTSVHRTLSRSRKVARTSVLLTHQRSSSDTVPHAWPPSVSLTSLITDLVTQHCVSGSNDADSRRFPVVIDMTFGSGVHSKALTRAIESDNLLLFAMDRDPAAVAEARQFQAEVGVEVVPFQAKFSECLSHFRKL